MGDAMEAAGGGVEPTGDTGVAEEMSGLDVVAVAVAGAGELPTVEEAAAEEASDVDAGGVVGA